MHNAEVAVCDLESRNALASSGKNTRKVFALSRQYVAVVFAGYYKREKTPDKVGSIEKKDNTDHASKDRGQHLRRTTLPVTCESESLFLCNRLKLQEQRHPA